MARPSKKIEFSTFVPSVTAGFISGMLVIILQISFAALIFSGGLAGQLSYGIGLTLFGAFVIGIVTALTSSFPGVISCLQGSPAVVLALMAGTIVSSMPASANAEDTFITVIAAIGMASFFSGALFWGLGRFKLGSLIRFVPYPVIGGFLAGTGLLLFVKAMGVMTETTISLPQLTHIMQSKIVIRWIPGAVFAVILLFIERRHRHYAIMPAVILFSIITFYLFLMLSGTTIPEARDQGLLLEPFQSGTLWRPLSFSVLYQVNWSAVAANAGHMGTIFIISLISLLLNASGLELAARRDIDLNRELQSAGLANIVSGLCTSPVGYHTLSLSVLVKKMGSYGRFAAILSASLCAVTLFFGGSLLSLLPKFILGGLLLFLGLSFLIEWLYDGWFKMPIGDYFIVILILLIIGFRGFLDGVGTGLVIAVILFVIKYSGIDVVKQTLTGANSKSNVDRPVEHRRLLRKRGEELLLLRLQGYIFFGTAHNLYRKVRKRTEDPALPDLRFVLLDFTRVTGLDSSAEVCFMKMMQLAQSEALKIVFSNIAPSLRHQLEKSVFKNENRSTFLIFPDEDHGIEWCENHFLAEENMLAADDKQPLSKYLEESFPNRKHIMKIMDYLEREELEEGYHLMRQGEDSDGLYFIESGQAIAQIHRQGTTGADRGRQNSQSDESIRLRVMRPGTVVGEVSMCLGIPRTATVVIGKPSVLFHLSSKALHQMEERDPDLAAALHHFIARLLAERLSDNTRTIQALCD